MAIASKEITPKKTPVKSVKKPQVKRVKKAAVARIKKHPSLNPLQLAKEKFSDDAVRFTNALFCRARTHSFPFGDRQLWIALRPNKSFRTAATLEFSINGQPLIVRLRDSSQIANLDPRFASLALEVYPDAVQAMILEIFLKPCLDLLEKLFEEEVELEKIQLKATSAKKSHPFAFEFLIYSANPHEDEEVPCLLRGSAALGCELAMKLVEHVSKVPVVPYRFHSSIVPQCLVRASQMQVSPEEVRNLRVGDVVLLENIDDMQQNLRQLIGLGAYVIHCQQDGNALTVNRIIKNENF